MKKTMLCSALFTLFTTQVFAELTPEPNQPKTLTTTADATPAVKAPAVPATTNTPAPAAKPAQVTPPTTEPAAKIIPATAPVDTKKAELVATPKPIDCDYKIPAETKTIDSTTVKTWTEKATVQSFDLDPAKLDGQMQKLQSCFTEQGWQGFNAALQKSGNLEVIKSKKLSVSSQVDGQTEVTEAKENQWKVSLPLQVVYQNDKEKATQALQINLTVGRKISGDLGIMQIVATPRNDVVKPVSMDKPADTSVPATPAETKATMPTETKSTPSTAPSATPENKPAVTDTKPATTTH